MIGLVPAISIRKSAGPSDRDHRHEAAEGDSAMPPSDTRAHHCPALIQNGDNFRNW
jgi:hypothetical protein